MKKAANLLLAVTWALCVALPAGATTIRVPSEQPTIVEGLDAAAAGDTVLVACDTYYEHDIPMKSGVCVSSETRLPGCVTIDAQQQGRIFSCVGVDSTTSFVGLTMTGGLAEYPDASGGAIRCEESSPKITHCVFTGNEATEGASLCFSYDSSLVVTDCVFESNDAVSGGGGIGCEGGSIVLRRCAFLNNTGSQGGGLDLWWPEAEITDCIFSGNEVEYYGGAVLCYGFSPTVERCTFESNHADEFGGAVFCFSNAAPEFHSCTLWGNSADANGAGIFCDVYSSPSIDHCIIAASTAGEAIYCHDENSVPTVTCCDIYGNAGGDWTGCVATQCGTDGNFSEDPLFCDAAGGDLTLCEDSPCLPGNHPGDPGACTLVGARDAGCPPCGANPVEETTWGATKALYRHSD